MKNTLRLIFFLLFYSFSHFSQAQELDSTMWVTDGYVSTTAIKGNTIYLGGFFNYVGPPTGHGAELNKHDEKLTHPSLQINSSVKTSVSDGKGGWYIGGVFTSVQGVNCKNLGHIQADGQLDQDWKVESNAPVHSLVVFNNTVYLSGTFTQINNQERNI